MATAVASGSLTNANDVVTLSPIGDQFATIQTSGTYSTAVLKFQGKLQNAASYGPIQAVRTDGSALESTTAAISGVTTWRVNISGMAKFQVLLSSIVSGTVVVAVATDNLPLLVFSNMASAEGQSGVLYDNNLVQQTVLYAQATVTTGSTDTALVAAVTAKKLRVLSMTIGNNGTATTACQVNSKPAGSGTIIWGPTGIIVDGSLVLAFNKHGWFQSNSGEGLSITQTGGTVGVNVTYIAV